MAMSVYCCETMESIERDVWDRGKTLVQSILPTGKTACGIPLNPTHFGLPYEEWIIDVSGGGYTAHAWNKVYTFTVPDNKVYAVKSIFDLTAIPVATKVKFVAGCNTVLLVDLHEMHVCGCPHIHLNPYMNEIKFYMEGTVVDVYVWLEAKTDELKLGFDGYVFESCCTTISGA